MKPKYLGDCLDFYKRWFLDEFFPSERLAAIPMLTEAWESPTDSDVYASLLRVEIIQDKPLPNDRDRSEYFNIDYAGRDVFLDPDTGLRVGPRPARKRYDEYLFANELRDLILPERSKRIAVIYDQSISRGSEIDSANIKLAALEQMDLWAFAYGAQVAMFTASRDRDRIVALHRHAAKLGHLLQDRVLTNVLSRNAK